jgi:hypothetical protein
MTCVMHSDRLVQPVIADVRIHDSNMENLPSATGTETMHYTKTEQDMQCTHNVRMRRIHANTAALEKQ